MSLHNMYALSGHILQSSCIVWSSMHLIRLSLLLILSAYAIEFPLKSAMSSKLSAYLFKFQLIRRNFRWIWYPTTDKKWLFLSFHHHSLVPKGVFYLYQTFEFFELEFLISPTTCALYVQCISYELECITWKSFVIWIISFCPFVPTHDIINFIFLLRYVKTEMKNDKLQNVNLRI